MKAFVVGNIAVDQTFAVNRLPAEGESIFGRKISTDLGGKGANQAIVLARSGIPTVLIAATGADPDADLLRDRLAAEPVTTRLIEVPDHASDNSIVMKDTSGGNVIVTTFDCARSLDVTDVEARMTDVVTGDLMVLQGNLDLATTRQIIAKARARHMRIVLNPSPFETGIEALLTDINVLFLNQHEAFQITGCEGPAAIPKLLNYGMETIVLSMGDKGALLGTATGIRTVPAHACDAIDSTGAGDTLQGVAIASALLHKRSIDVQDVQIAAEAAALTVSRPGTTSAFPTQAELAQLMARRHPLTYRVERIQTR